MLSSIDGKISTGNTNERDVDKDFPKINRLKEGLKQYYDLEMKTDLHSFNTGKVMAKIGMNIRRNNIKKTPVSFVIVDNKPHLNKVGIINLIEKSKKLYLITTNKKHPAFKVKSSNLEIIYYKNKIDFPNLFVRLRNKYKINRVTIQSGGSMNSVLIRKGLIDELSLVFAPALIGGKNTPSLMGGTSLHSDKDLKQIKALKLVRIDRLNNSYLHLIYKIIN